jgi:ubiquinone/menaquinone biosynthesis C-methylase UbiE
MSYTDWKVWRDPAVVARFTDRRRGGLLGGDVQLETMLRLVAAVGATAPVVLDLGCGDGVLLETIMAAYPDATGVALDGSAAMLERARARLGDTGRVQFVQADFNDAAWSDALHGGVTFDAVVSGFAIHHSEDMRKRELYAEVFGLLKPGGVFINVEHVASATPRGEQFFEEAWVENVARFRRENGEHVDYAAALAEFRARPDKAANRLAPVETQLSWFREIGFADVDCYWKQFELAVLAGYRPVASSK